MLSAIQSWIKSKQRKNRRPAARRAPGRTLRVESLERRELLAADMAGVVRGSNQYLLDTDRDPAVEIDRSYGLKNDMHVIFYHSRSFIALDRVVVGGDEPGQDPLSEADGSNSR